MAQTYCLACKQQKEILGAEKGQFKNGTPVIRGKCDKGHKIFKIIKKSEANQA